MSYREELEQALGVGRKLVFGEGPVNAKLAMIGEAPGEQEETQGKPFVGKAGQNLNVFLEVAHLRRESIYVTNTVKFRPTKISKAGNTVNRPPTREEVQAFLPWLARELKAVSPEWIVTLGNVPLQALLGTKCTVGECHGSILTWKGIRLYPMYHPASMIYNPTLKQTYLEDMLRLTQLL